MSILKVLTVPDPFLKIKAKPVTSVDKHIRKIMDDMLETMIFEKGIGLAATQVGIDKRIIVMDVPLGLCSDGSMEESENMPHNHQSIFKMANPEIIWQSAETSQCNEGCLSVPEQRGFVIRPAHVKLRFIDEHNNPQEINMNNLQATCVQHEIDHLNGKLFIDYFSPLKRNMIIRKVQRLEKAYE